MDHSPVTPDQCYRPNSQDWTSFAFNHASTPSRRTSTRITKPGYFYNSPQGVQRRRTTASHRVRGSSISQSEARHVAQLQRDSSLGRRWNINAGRPVSWHPCARSSQSFSHDVHGGEQALGNTIDGLEHLAVSSNGPPVIDTSATVQYPTSEASNMYGMPNLYFGQPMYMMTDAAAQNYSFETPSTYPSTQLYSSNSGLNAETIPCYVSSDYAATVPVYHGDGIVTRTTLAPTSNLQDPSHQQTPQPQLQSQSPTLRARLKKSSELIGMGLYDDTTKVQRESVGKTLKLEDSWQPPGKMNEGDDKKVEDDQDDESSTDDDDDDEDDEDDDEEPPRMPVSSTLPDEVPVYQDLSNQSFFFENDDSYGHFMTAGPDIPLYQPKVPEPVQATFSWI